MTSNAFCLIVLGLLVGSFVVVSAGSMQPHDEMIQQHGSTQPYGGALTRTKYILDHDGGVDDIIALMLILASVNHVELVGCIVTNADCVGAVALNTTLKILHLLGPKPSSSSKAISVGLSTLNPVNPFPDIWWYVTRPPLALGWKSRMQLFI